MHQLIQELRDVYTEWEERVRQQGLSEGLQEGLQKGLQKGRQEGLQEGERALLRRQLEKRFGPLPPEIATRVAHAEVEDVERWADRVLVAQTLDEVFRH